jgi:hypothetical protein
MIVGAEPVAVGGVVERKEVRGQSTATADGAVGAGDDRRGPAGGGRWAAFTGISVAVA